MTTTALQTTTGPVEPQLVLLLDDDSSITEGLAMGLEREGRSIISCNDVESAELMVDRFHPSHVVADIRISGPFGCEGLDFVRYVRRLAPETRVILMSGHVPDELQLEGSERGAVAFLKKPFAVAELDGILNLISCSPLSATGHGQRHVRIPMMDEILDPGLLRAFFQPIVALDHTERVVGYESLARCRTESPMRDPDLLFRYAMKKHRVSELEYACIAGTMTAMNRVSRTGLVFINLHPDVFTHASKLAEIIELNALLGDVAPDRIVLEITEQGSLPDTPAVIETISRLRHLGIRFALDDVGVAYSHLPMIGKLQPSYMKISQEFGTGFEKDRSRVKIIGNIMELAREFDCQVIIEGVEDRSTALAAMDLGIPLAQGYLFGRPAEAPLMAGVSDEI
jgi:EAL domain-containing protein (putative c-di-GMP-specific phosphodiesterase class I)/ActR/RegA family two-component response regulator